MRTSHSSSSRSDNARNEARDSQGRFTSKDDQKKSSRTTASSDHRGSNAKNEARDSEGRFTSKDNKK